MKKIMKIIAAGCLLMALATTQAHAQPEGWDDESSADTPVDGGLCLLVAAGVGYGLRRHRHNGKKG